MASARNKSGRWYAQCWATALTASDGWPYPQDAADFIRRNHRLPNQVFIGAESLALPDFVATLATAVVSSSDAIPVTRGSLEFEKYFATDSAKSFNWVIHPQGFSAPELLELGKLQGWTLKPAQFAPMKKKS